MRRIHTALIMLSIASFAVIGVSAGAAEPATPANAVQPTATQPAPPVENGGKITKSRSNIQNNREAAAPPAKAPVDAAPAAEQSVVKTKTKSNQSND